MAVTLAIVSRPRHRTALEVIVDVTGPNPYATGGEALTAAQQAQLFPELGAGQALDMTKAEFVTEERDATGTFATLVKATGKIMFWTAAHAEVANGTNLSARTNRLRILYGVRKS